MSRNATEASVEATTSAGISPEAIRQNKHSSAMPPDPTVAAARTAEHRGRSELGEPAAQKRALDVVIGQVESLQVRRPRFADSAQPAKKVRPGSGEVSVAGQLWLVDQLV